MLLLRRRRLRQPPPGVTIDRSDPLSRGLIAAVSTHGPKPLDALGRQAVTLTGAPTIVRTLHGSEVYTDGVDDLVEINLGATYSVPLSLFGVFTIDPTSDVFVNGGFVDAFLSLSSTVTNFESFGVGIFNNAAASAVAQAGAWDDTSGSGIAANGTTNLWNDGGVRHSFGATFTGSLLDVYLDGRHEGNYNAGSRDPQVVRMTIGATYQSNFPAGPSAYAEGLTTCALAYNRILSAAEMFELHRRSWRVYRADRRRWVVPTPGGDIYRPGSDIIVGSWTAVGESTLWQTMNKTSVNDATYAKSPSLAGLPTLTQGIYLGASPASIPAGTWVVRVRPRETSAAEIRVVLLNDSNAVQGTSAWTAVTGTFTTIELSVTTTGTSTRVRTEGR